MDQPTNSATILTECPACLTVSGCTFFSVATFAPDYYGGGFPPLQAHRLIAAGTLHVDLATQAVTLLQTTAPMNQERSILQWCSDSLAALGNKGILGTFYGDLFTLPLLYWRAVHYGVPLILPDPCWRFDLASWTTFGFADAKRPSISDCAEAMGLPKRFNPDLSKYFYDQNAAAVSGFISTDLLIYCLVWLRLLLVGGLLKPETFTTFGHWVMKFFYQHDDTARTYIQQTNHREFLLLPPAKPAKLAAKD